MKWKSMDVVLAVSVELSTIKYQSSPFAFYILKGNFKVERLSVHYFALYNNKWLNKSQLLPVLFWHLPLGLLISNICISFN